MAAASTTTKKKGAKTVARKYIEALGEQRLDDAVAMWRAGSIDHFHGMVDLTAPGGVRAWFSELFAAFPDWSMEVVDAAGSGDRAAIRWRAKATFTGPGRFQGLTPTGAEIEIEGCDMFSVENGVIVENHAYVNANEIAQKLGVMPPQGSFGERAMTAGVIAKTSATKLIRRAVDR